MQNKMKNISLILIFAIIFTAGCNSKSQSSKIGDIGSAGSGWTKNYRNNFLQDCIGKASKTVSPSEAFTYCNCMTEKVEAKYPDEMDVDAKLLNTDIAAMKQDCLASNSKKAIQQKDEADNSNSQGWSDSDQRVFIDNCIPTVNKTLGTSGAAGYCDCLLKKLMQEYPDSKDVDKASRAHLAALASECLKK